MGKVSCGGARFMQLHEDAGVHDGIEIRVAVAERSADASNGVAHHTPYPAPIASFE